MAERIHSLIDSHKMLTNAVSHELRTPLSRLRFGAEMLNNADKRKKREQYSAGLLLDIDALEDLVNELLTYAKYDREKMTLNIRAMIFMEYSSICAVIIHYRSLR